MRGLESLFAELEEAAADPQRAFERYGGDGQQAIGCIPYFAPYELVHAAGLYPVELWGGDTETSEASGYYPAFYCSVLVTLMERALRGEYDFLSGVIVPTTCDGLRNLGENWKFGVKGATVMSLVQPMSRTSYASEEYYLCELHEIAAKLEEISGARITDRALRASVNAYNRQRAVMREFSAVAAEHLDAVTPWQRHLAFRAARTMPVEVHTQLMREVIDALKALPCDTFSGIRLVSTGILMDSKSLYDELAERNISIVGDVITAESVRFAQDAPGNVDPFVSLAHVWLDMRNTSVAFDVKKERGLTLARLAEERGADGALIDVTKFCEEEEFDYPVLKRQLADAGLPVLYLETAQQDHINEQAATRIQAFAEMIG